MPKQARTALWVGVGLLVTAAVGGAIAFVWIRIADRPDENAGERRAELFEGLTGIEDARKTQAQLVAMNLARAIDAYQINPANPDSSPPTSLQDLLRPPFGGPSYLKNGQGALLDPWGQPFQLRVEMRPDGVDRAVVFTTAPDGTLITQFGIGQAGEAKW